MSDLFLRKFLYRLIFSMLINAFKKCSVAVVIKRSTEKAISSTRAAHKAAAKTPESSGTFAKKLEGCACA